MKSKLVWSTILTMILLISSSGIGYAKPNQVTPAYWGYPTFSITSVHADNSVTIKTHNLPPSDTFKVLMGKMGTKGIGGIYVDTISTGSGGTKSFSYSIPAALYGKYQIAIRLQSTTGSGYYAYNWFYNNTAKGSSKKHKGYSAYPTFSIVGVVKNKNVTIKTFNLPKNDTFKVLMNYMGTKGVGGALVDTFNSGSGGSKVLKFKIPASLKNDKRIAIRIQSTTGSGYYAYNWFYNNTYP